MKIICKKSDLNNSINIVMKAVPSKTTMDILECIVIDVNDSINLITNDTEIGIKPLVEGEIIERGSIAIKAKVFSEIIRKLPDEEIIIETDYDYNTTIVCGKSKFNIAGNRSDEFPLLPVVEKNNAISISQFNLKEIIRQTVFSIADNENNKIMTGELFEIEDNRLKVVSLDGHRISIRNLELSENYNYTKVIVPGKTLIEISKILSGEIDKQDDIYISDKHILFEFNDSIVLSRLIEGEYFKINQMLSSDYETKLTVNKREFLDCLDRATLLIKESEKKPIVISVTENSMELKINSSIGSMNEDIDIVKEGADIIIGFNPRFLIDALRVIEDDEIDIYLLNPRAPCFIRDKENKYIYLILPINIIAG